LRGVIRSQDDLPKSAEIGGEYVLADRSVGWVWMVRAALRRRVAWTLKFISNGFHFHLL